MYTIGQVSEMFNLPISTLRYYDKEGLFPEIKRKGNTRIFEETEIEALRVIECLKASGLSIREIKQFMDWSKDGAKTYEKRRALFEERKKVVQEEMEKLQKTLDMLEFKCRYYDTAMEDGNEERLKKIIPEELPEDIRPLYENTHQ